MTFLLSNFSKPKIRLLADSLTLLRALLGIPLIIALSFQSMTIGWVIVLIAAVTDFTDGWLARYAGGGTSFGAKLDPLADKFFLNAAFLWLAKESILPLWGIWLLISRELLISHWRSNTRDGRPASKLGKTKTLLQFLSLILIFMPISWTGTNLSYLFNQLGILVFWISLAFAYLSGIKYLMMK